MAGMKLNPQIESSPWPFTGYPSIITTKKVANRYSNLVFGITEMEKLSLQVNHSKVCFLKSKIPYYPWPSISMTLCRSQSISQVMEQCEILQTWNFTSEIPWRRGGDEEDILNIMRHQKFMTQIHTSVYTGSMILYKFRPLSERQLSYL